jgi:hypothetical protein
MKTRASRYVTYGQWNLIVFVIVCISLHPGFVLKRDEGGFSNYGIHIKTVVPYSLTYVGCALFTLLGATAIPKVTRDAKILAVMLRAYSFVCLFLLLSTYGYSLNAPLKAIHGALGLIAMVFDPAASVWLFLQMRRSRWDRTLLGVECVGLALGIIDFFNVGHVLFAAQAVIAVGFGFLLARGTHLIEGETGSVA